MRRTLTLCAVLVLLLGACGSGDKPPGGNNTPTTVDESLAGVDGPPPWPLGDRQVDRIEAAGITGLHAEGTRVHYHAHLDVFYDGDAVEVPKYIGIDFDDQVISPMHTHTTAGVIHIEADRDEEFTLGQFLTQWGVRADGDCVADKCGDEVAVFVNGSIQDDPAADVVIKADTEIALVLGTPPADIPSGYDCSKRTDDECPNIPNG